MTDTLISNYLEQIIDIEQLLWKDERLNNFIVKNINFFKNHSTWEKLEEIISSTDYKDSNDSTINSILFNSSQDDRDDNLRHRRYGFDYGSEELDSDSNIKEVFKNLPQDLFKFSIDIVRSLCNRELRERLYGGFKDW